MKVVYIVPNPNRIGGVSQSIRRVTDELQNLNVDVSVFCPDFDAMNNLKKPDMVIMRELLFGSSMQEWTQRCIEKLKKEKPDIVIGYFASSAGYCATAAAKYLNIPVVVSLRGSDVNRDFFAALHNFKLPFICKHANAVTTVSTDMQYKVQSWLDREAIFIPNSVNKTIFKPVSNTSALREKLGLDHRPIVALLGEFKSSRGLGVLKHLKEVLQNVQTILVGHIRPEAKKQIPNWVTTIEYMNNTEDLVTFYNMCDLVLQPSLYDGMPNVVLEAMACECTVIGSSVGGIKDLIIHGENGYLCDSPEEWQQTITYALKHPDSTIGKQARVSVNTPKEEAKAFYQVFNDVLKNNLVAYESKA